MQLWQSIQINLCVVCSDQQSSDNDKIWNRSQILDFDVECRLPTQRWL